MTLVNCCCKDRKLSAILSDVTVQGDAGVAGVTGAVARGLILLIFATAAADAARLDAAEDCLERKFSRTSSISADHLVGSVSSRTEDASKEEA